MNWLDFFSSIIGSVAWPIAFVVAVVIYKEPLQKLLERITDVEVWGSKASFIKSLKGAEFTAELIPSIENEATPALEPRDDDYLKLAEQYPGAAVVEAFKKVEAVLDEWQDGQGMTHPPSNEGLVQWLVQDGYLSDVVFHLYKKVKQTRNIAVHAQSPNISTGEAIAYKDLCVRLERFLKEALWQWNSKGKKGKPIEPIGAEVEQD